MPGKAPLRIFLSGDVMTGNPPDKYPTMTNVNIN